MDEKFEISNERLRNVLKEAYRKLPKKLQDAITNAQLGEQIANISEQEKLRVDQSGELYIQTVMVILGLAAPADMLLNLEESLKTDHESAIRIARQVSEKILTPIREDLIRTHKLVPLEETEAPAAQPLNKPASSAVKNVADEKEDIEIKKIESQPSLVSDNLTLATDEEKKPAPAAPPSTETPPSSDPYREVV